MDGKHYKILRDKDNKEKKKKQTQTDYKVSKMYLVDAMTNFITSDNLCDLAKMMKVGAEILEKEKFPYKKFSKFQYKGNGKKR